jgi:hypothetical protein
LIAVSSERQSFAKTGSGQTNAKNIYKTGERRFAQGEQRVDDLALTSILETKWTGSSEPWIGGKASPVHGALPGSIYFILKYGDQPPEEGLRNALAFNAMVGGDSSARALPIGLIMGARVGLEKGLPQGWLAELNCRESVGALVDEVLAKRSRAADNDNP